jgi:outer membrane receptor for ferrienterochelin and colicin
MRFLGLFLSVFLLALPAFSQSSKGSIGGTVTDTSGAVVPGATVVITDVSRGTSRTLMTNQAGAYVAPELLASTYTIEISAKGFANVKRSNIELQVAQALTVDFTIKPGAASQTVVVSGGAPLLNTTSATLGGTLSNSTINSLPLNGRNFLNLLTLRPGVMIHPGGGFQTQSANGLRPTTVSYLLDGLMEYEPFQGQSMVNESNFAGDAATILPIDAIQQFNVVQNPPAQYGWAPGAVANVALKSGTNQIHGTAYAFGRDGTWDAKNFFNTGTKAPLSLQQFGGSVGGPILKDKLFYFATYEGQRYNLGTTNQSHIPVTVPLPGNGAGCAILTTGDCTQSVPNALADLQAQGYSENSVSAKMLALFPNNTGSSIDMPVVLTENNRSDDGVGKIDYQLTPHQQLSYNYFFGNQTGLGETINVVAPQFLSLLTMRVQTHGFHWTWNPNPRWVNSFRFGYDLFHQGLPAIVTADWTKSAASYGIPTGVTNPLAGGLPDFFISGFSMLGGDFVLPKLLGPNYSYEMDDTVSYLHGNHYFNFGVQEQHWIVNAARLANARGRLKFNHCADGATPLECFLVGQPFLGILLQGNPLRRVNQWASSFFFEDSWHARPTLTVNMGMRYNYLTPMKDAHGGLANFDPKLGIIQQGLNGIGSVYNADPHDWSPRLGFAWNPHSGSTVIRGGASLMYSRIDLFSMLSQVGLSNAFTTGLAAIPTQGIIPNGNINTTVSFYGGGQLNYNSTGPVFPTLDLACPPVAGSGCAIMGVPRNLKNPSVVNWSLGIQHAFGSNLTLDASYVGNHGRNALGVLDINQVNQNSPAEIACGHCEQDGRPYNSKYPYLSYINMMGNNYRSNYNGLQLTLNERGFHGLSFIAGYTWSHALDQSSVNIASNPPNSLNPGAEYANSDWNVPQRFTFSTTYSIPGGSKARMLTNGWHITSIVTLQSGMPWGVLDTGNDPSLTGEFADRWNFFGSRSAFNNVSSTSIPWFPGGDPSTGGLTSNQACNSRATTPAEQASLAAFGCFAKGGAVMLPPAMGTFGTMGRNTFVGPGFYNWDASLFKDIRIGEKLTAQFRAEFFNLLNTPTLTNPQFNGAGGNDPSAPQQFGAASTTADVQANNAVLGSGGPRAIQLGLKLIF